MILSIPDIIVVLSVVFLTEFLETIKKLKVGGVVAKAFFQFLTSATELNLLKAEASFCVLSKSNE